MLATSGPPAAERAHAGRSGNGPGRQVDAGWGPAARRPRRTMVAAASASLMVRATSDADQGHPRGGQEGGVVGGQVGDRVAVHQVGGPHGGDARW